MLIKIIKLVVILLIVSFSVSLIDMVLTETDSVIWRGYGYESEPWERLLARGVLLFFGLLLISVSAAEALNIFGIKNIIYKSVKIYSVYSAKLIGNALCLYFSIIIYILVFYIPYKIVVWLFF